MGGEEKEGEEEEEEKILYMCESIGHRPLRGRCPAPPSTSTTTYLRRRIFEGKLSVSPYFLHHCQDNNEAGMLLVNILSLKTLGVYLIIIF